MEQLMLAVKCTLNFEPSQASHLLKQIIINIVIIVTSG